MSESILSFHLSVSFEDHRDVILPESFFSLSLLIENDEIYLYEGTGESGGSPFNTRRMSSMAFVRRVEAASRVNQAACGVS